jgi:putative cardiolipin synthase
VNGDKARIHHRGNDGSNILNSRSLIAFQRRIPASAYEVRLSDSGQLYWVERREGEWVRHDTEPGTSFGQRVEVWLMSMLPIEWLL